MKVEREKKTTKKNSIRNIVMPHAEQMRNTWRHRQHCAEMCVNVCANECVPVVSVCVCARSAAVRWAARWQADIVNILYICTCCIWLFLSNTETACVHANSNFNLAYLMRVSDGFVGHIFFCRDIYINTLRNCRRSLSCSRFSHWNREGSQSKMSSVTGQFWM